MSSYREQFFEWVNRQPVYQDMPLQTKEITLNLVDCWLNNNQAYFHYAKLNGKEFAKMCAIDFCWFIKNQAISDLQYKLDIAEKALNKMSNYAINDNDLYDLVSDFNIENERYDEDHLGIDARDVIDYFKEQAKKEVKGE